MLLRIKGLLEVNDNGKTLVNRMFNKSIEFMTTENGDWRSDCIFKIVGCRKIRKPGENFSGDDCQK